MKVFVNAIPKSGTNLLQRLMELLGLEYDKLGVAASLILGKNNFPKKIIRGNILGNNPFIVGYDVEVPISEFWMKRRFKKISNGKYVSGHANFTEKIHKLLIDNCLKTIIIIRDPRSILLSNAKYFFKREDYYLYKLYKSKDLSQRISIALDGGYYDEIGLYLNSLDYQLENLKSWKNKDEVLIVKFEDLIGEKGGGSNGVQFEKISEIMEFIGMSDLIESKFINNIANNLFGNSVTFNSGLINSWEKEISKSQLSVINEKLFSHMEYWNYS